MLAHLRNFQFDIPDIGHREEVGDLPPAPDQTPVLLDTEQHVRRLPAVSNDHRPPFGGLLGPPGVLVELAARSEEHTSELQSLMRNSYAVFCLKKKKTKLKHNITNNPQIQT